MYISITDQIEIDREQRKTKKSGKDIHLTGLEFGILEYLATHPNRICTRQEILDSVWGDRFRYDTGTIDVHLNAIRRKMEWSRTRPIEAIRGIGFIFHIAQQKAHYTYDLQQFMRNWLVSHEVDLKAAGLVGHLQMTPFVNELTIEPEVLRRLLDSALSALLPIAHPGALHLTSKLTMEYFILSLDINGVVSELRIPIGG